MKLSLSKTEIEALLAAAGNVDPCIFDEIRGRQGTLLYRGWVSAQTKLREAVYPEYFTQKTKA